MSSTMKFYLLENRIPKEVSLEEWQERFWMSASRRVARDEIETIDATPVVVSTVFLGLDHSVRGPPQLFESMVFGGPLDGTQHRYSTWEEAERGHKHLLAESVTEEKLVAWQAQQAIALAKE